MAKLNDPSTQARPVPRQVGGIVQRPVVAPADIGQGIRYLGRSLEEGADELYRAQKIEEDRINTLRAEDAFNRLREKQLDLTLGEENGFTKLKGAEAVSRPLQQEWGKRFDDAVNEISRSLSNDEQRSKFKPRADVVRLQYQEGMLRHQATQGDAFAKEVYDGTVTAEQQNAVARWDSPNDIALSLARVKNAVEERSERYGWDQNYRDTVLSQEHGKIHAAVIQQAIVSKNYVYAEEWYKKNRDDIDLATAKTLAVAVENGKQKELTNNYNTQYLANENNQPALESLRKTVLKDQALDEDRRNILVGRIQNRQFVLERRIEVENERKLRTIGKAVNDFNANTLAGFEAKPEQMQPLLDAAKGTEMEPEVRRAMQLADATRVFRNAAPLNQEQMLTQAEAGVREDPTKFDRNVVNAWRSIYDAQRRQVKEDPVGFAVRQGVITPPTPLDLSQPAEAGPALAERFAIARGVSANYQAPFKPLTTEETTLLKTSLERATPAQKRAYLGSLFTASGNDMPGYMGIMGQLAPDDPVTAIAGSQAARGNNMAADLMLRGQAILRPSTKADGKPDSSGLLPLPPETEMRAAFDNTMREAFAGKAEMRNAHYQAAKSIYAALSSDAGDRDTKIMDSDRWEQSMELAIGTVEKYEGRRVVLPQGVEYGDFKDGVRSRIDSLAASSRLDPTWTVSRLRDLPLENIGDGRYVFKSGDGVVVDKSGLPVMIDFNDHGKLIDVSDAPIPSVPGTNK